jgi:hypothetical protein
VSGTMATAARSVTSNVRVIERMTSPPGRCLNEAGCHKRSS